MFSITRIICSQCSYILCFQNTMTQNTRFLITIFLVFQVTCYCGKPFAGRPMVECSKCLTWVHLKCAGLRRTNIPDTWHCKTCKPTLKVFIFIHFSFWTIYFFILAIDTVFHPSGIIQSGIEISSKSHVWKWSNNMMKLFVLKWLFVKSMMF